MVNERDDYVLIFDETLNSNMLTKQMDTLIRTWNHEGGEEKSCTYGSVFMRHATAVDMRAHFNAGTDDWCLTKVLHISINGPNMSWNLFSDLQVEVQKNFDKQKLNVGICGLHIVHGAFQNGVTASTWCIEKQLSSLYWFFDIMSQISNLLSTGSCQYTKMVLSPLW